MLSCREATELMTDDREGKLAESCRVSFRFHMFLCVHCRRYRRQLEMAIAAAKQTEREEVPPAVEEKLVAAFRARRGGGPDKAE